MKHRFLTLLLLFLSTYLWSSGSPERPNTTRILRDMAGTEFSISPNPRIAVLDKSLVIQTLIALGADDLVVSTGGIINPNSATPTRFRDTLFLRPKLMELPNFGYASYGGLNIETLAGSKPDVLIWHMLANTAQDEKTRGFIEQVKSLGIPVFIVKSAGVAGALPEYQSQSAVIRTLGKLVQKEARAEAIINRIEAEIQKVMARTGLIKETERVPTMVAGISKDGTAYIWGTEYGSALFLSRYSGIKNISENRETRLFSKEQILTNNPDKIILVDGPYAVASPDEVYSLPGMEEWKSLSALKNREVYSVGITPWWGDYGLGYPTLILITAKAVYPNLFNDINVHTWLTDYQQFLYGIPADKCVDLAEMQKLKWIYEKQW